MTEDPERRCLGDPEREPVWCGEPATHVGRDETGLEWFCCPRHHRGAGSRAGTRLLPVAEWFEDLRTAVAAHEAAELLLAMAAEDRAARS